MKKMRSPSVKTLRSKLGMTQQAFASLLGISFVSVNKWENGGSTPTGLSAVLLALLKSALRAHPPLHVVQALRSAGGDSLAVVRVLTELERTHGDREPELIFDLGLQRQARRSGRRYSLLRLQ